MLKKLRKLLWLIQHFPSLVKAYNGTLSLCAQGLSLIKKVGFRSAFGIFIGQVAYEERHLPTAYLQWIRNNENKTDHTWTFERIQKQFGESYLFLLHPNAKINDVSISKLAAALTANPAGDIFYGDHDEVSDDEKRSKPFFKPCFSIDLLRSSNYLGPLIVVKKASIALVGKLDLADNNLVIYDWLLRAHESRLSFIHIPHILSHMKSWETQASEDTQWPIQSDLLLKHLQRCYAPKLEVGVTDNGNGRLTATYKKRNALASIIIPTKDQRDYLEQCVNSILAETIGCRYEIIILNNNSKEEATYKWFESVKNNPLIKVVDAHYEFNWSRLNNQGIAESNGDVFVFLNNDTKVITKTWLSQLSGQALRDEVGTVGPLLLYEDGTVQHAGVVIGFGGQADHIYAGFLPFRNGSAFVSPLIQRNVLASTGACLSISKKTIAKIGTFDEQFSVIGSDIEISIRASRNGLTNVYEPSVKLYHYESKTRLTNRPVSDLVKTSEIYNSFVVDGDPFYNCNLSLTSKYPHPNVV